MIFIFYDIIYKKYIYTRNQSNEYTMSFSQVSWIRHHDLHILTVGRYTYTADMRFHSKYNAKKDEWRLEVQSVQKHDSGRYECQVNTQPVRSFFVQLNVVGK